MLSHIWLYLRLHASLSSIMPYFLIFFTNLTVKSPFHTISDIPLVHSYNTTNSCLCFFSYHRTAVFREGKLLPTYGDPSFIPS